MFASKLKEIALNNYPDIIQTIYIKAKNEIQNSIRF